MTGHGSWLDSTGRGLRYLFSSDNPFVPWMLVIDLVLLVLHLSIVYWVYRDALARFNRGAPWAVLAAVLPVAGWLFYLLYRNSPLVQLDRIEAELFDEDEPEWTDYDAQQAKQGSVLFQELGSLWRKAEAEGYSPWIRHSRARELYGKLTPKERKARAEERHKRRDERRAELAVKRETAREKRKARISNKRERTTLAAAHGFMVKMSEGRQRKIKRRLELVTKLQALPREDERLEEMIYNMEYRRALQSARDSLGVAEEMGDKQGTATFESYIARLERIIQEEHTGKN